MSKSYKIGDIVDLDDVALTQAAHDAWCAAAAVGAQALPAHIRPSDIPIEQGLWLASGELEIFVEIPGATRISMKVPQGEWGWKQ